MQAKGKPRMEEREAITIRFPPVLVARAGEIKNDGESPNDLVVTALVR
jgi:hypothetical protein